MTNTETTWIIEPRDPLLVRDGRPFGADPGARATSLPFPYPSTIAGSMRTRAGSDAEGRFLYQDAKLYKQELNALKNIPLFGPLLVELGEQNGEIKENGWLLPAPRDAAIVPLESSGTAPLLERLVPVQIPNGAQTDLGSQVPFLVGQPGGGERKKPLSEAPNWWYWEHLALWLLNPEVLQARLHGSKQELVHLGLRQLQREQRMHVSIESKSFTAKDGMLFETAGLEFTTSSRKRLALALATTANLAAGLGRMGSERRLVSWRPSQVSLPHRAPELEEAIVHSCHFRVILLTPAHFEKGYAPTWLQDDAARSGLKIKLQAIAISRPQVVSGWDLAQRTPKPSRRLAPAGTVLFFSLIDGEENAFRAWIDQTWMHCVSDRPEDRTDGFGLAVLGTWPGQSVPMEGRVA